MDSADAVGRGGELRRAAHGDPGRDAREQAERIAALLDDVHAMAGQPTWQRVEELVQRLVALYGAGLERLLDLVAEGGAFDDALEARLAKDELISSLLVLHGLHPIPTIERVERALAEVRPYLGSHSGDVALLDLDDAGVAHLELLGSCHGCPSSRATLEQTIRAAIEAAAPEVTEIEVRGVTNEPAESAQLVQIDLRRSRGEAAPRVRWSPAPELDGLAPGERRALHAGNTPVLALSVGGTMLAYRDECPACGSGLETAAIDGSVLSCASCDAPFDLVHAGRRTSGDGPGLAPIPLLVEAGAVRLQLPEDAA
jgi:Fe-S cluster biogenesis protein NfuA/nitrite reductase/ring-hydroxylating ferredoxin subunit